MTGWWVRIRRCNAASTAAARVTFLAAPVIFTTPERANICTLKASRMVLRCASAGPNSTERDSGRSNVTVSSKL